MSEWEPQEGEVVNRDEHGNPDVIMVSSDSRDDPYAVRFTTLRVENEDTDEESYIHAWVCSCKAYEYGGGKPCKHIKRVIPERLIVDLSPQSDQE
jgi:hypothetical protein